ncbi:MAG: winged helix-turn-helix domain-containing protein [Desulfurococcaceae archaeon]
MSSDPITECSKKIYIGTYGAVTKELAILESSTRKAIIYQLAVNGPMTIKELSDSLGLSPSTVYDHIRKLKEAGYIEEASEHPKKFKVEVYYRLSIPYMFFSEISSLEPHLSPQLEKLKGAIRNTLSNIESTLKESRLKCVEYLPQNLKESFIHRLSLVLMTQAFAMILGELTGETFVYALIEDRK